MVGDLGCARQVVDRRDPSPDDAEVERSDGHTADGAPEHRPAPWEHSPEHRRPTQRDHRVHCETGAQVADT